LTLLFYYDIIFIVITVNGKSSPDFNGNRSGRSMMEDTERKPAQPNPELVGRLIAAKGGDERVLAGLIDEYNPLLLSTVAEFGENLSHEDREELMQEARLGFYSSVRSYDPLFGNVTFGAYAKRCVRNRVITAVTSMQSEPRPLPLPDEPTGAHASPLAEYLALESLEELRRKIRSCLSDFENSVFWQHYNGVPVSVIAERAGKSKKSIENALYRIKRKLRAALSAG